MEMERFEKWLLTGRGWQLFARHAALPWVLHSAQLPAVADVLEVGTGAGFNGETLLERFPGWKLLATDYDPDMVEKARSRLMRFGERVRVEQADATALRYPDKSFDLVVSLGVWHHVGNWEAALRESARVLRPGGKLLLADLLRGFFWGPLGRLFPPARAYGRDELVAALAPSGFAGWEMRGGRVPFYRLLASAGPSP